MIQWNYVTTADTGGYTEYVSQSSSAVNSSGQLSGSYTYYASFNRYGQTIDGGRTQYANDTYYSDSTYSTHQTQSIGPNGITNVDAVHSGTAYNNTHSGGTYGAGTSTTITVASSAYVSTTSTFTDSVYTSTSYAGYGSYTSFSTSARTDIAETTVSSAGTSHAVTTVSQNSFYVDTVGVTCFLAEDNEVLWIPTVTALGIYAVSEAAYSIGPGEVATLSSNCTYAEINGAVTAYASTYPYFAYVSTTNPVYGGYGSSGTTISQITNTSAGGITTTTASTYRFYTSSSVGNGLRLTSTSQTEGSFGTLSYYATEIGDNTGTAVGFMTCATDVGTHYLNANYATYVSHNAARFNFNTVTTNGFVFAPASTTSFSNSAGAGASYTSCSYAMQSLGVGYFGGVEGNNPYVALKQPNIGWKLAGSGDLGASIDGFGTNIFASSDGSYCAVSFSTSQYYGASGPVTYASILPYQTVPVPFPQPQQWADSNSVMYRASWNGATVSLTTQLSTSSGSQVIVFATDNPITETLFRLVNGFDYLLGNTNVFVGSGTYPDLTGPNTIYYGQGAYQQSMSSFLVTDYLTTTLTTADFIRTLAAITCSPASYVGRQVLVDVRTDYNQ